MILIRSAIAGNLTRFERRSSVGCRSSRSARVFKSSMSPWAARCNSIFTGHKLPGTNESRTFNHLRYDGKATHRFEKVNSSHHQAIDRLGDGFEVEAWCADDDVIEQVRLRDYPFALAVQYHPERGERFTTLLFEDFFSRLKLRRSSRICRQLSITVAAHAYPM